MPDPSAATVVVIDDDELVRGTIRATLESVGHAVVAHDAAEPYLAAGPPERPCCLLADMRMPGMSGLALLRRLGEQADAPPVIVITGHADVPATAETFRAGAFDFIQKPFSMNALIELVARALDEDRRRLAAIRAEERRQALVAELSPREREVMAPLVRGLSNKEIARLLDISPRTVERHRDNIFEKVGVRNAVELVGLLNARPET